MPNEGLSAEAFLGELVRRHPTVEDISRQNSVAHWLVDQFRRDGIGDTRLVPYASEIGLIADDYPERLNVVVEVKGKGTGTKEKVLLYGHYDVVKPSLHYKKISHLRSPFQLVTDPVDPNWKFGLGSADMQSGNTAIREALLKMQLAAHRDILVVLASDEEGASRGFHGAYNSRIFDGVDCAITPEILVNPRLLPPEKDHALIIGRPGRFGLLVTSTGMEMHAGAVTDDDISRLTESLDQRAVEAIRQLPLNGHPNDPEHLTPPPQALSLHLETMATGSLTVPASFKRYVNVHYWDHQQEPHVIAEMLRQRLRGIAREIFHDDPEKAQQAYTVSLEERPTPFTPPWKEEYHHPFISRMQELMNRVNVRARGRPDAIHRVVDQGVADCGLIANYLHCPVVGTPLRRRDPHQHTEQVYFPDIDYIADVIAEAAAYPGLLSER